MFLEHLLSYLQLKMNNNLDPLLPSVGGVGERDCERLRKGNAGEFRGLGHFDFGRCPIIIIFAKYYG